MALNSQHIAPGGPGIEPRWTHGAKVAVGTAYSTSSHVWCTLDPGCVTELYFRLKASGDLRHSLF
jgi:glucoamylase